MQLKDRIKELRAICDLSVPQLAEKLKKGISTIRMWEVGRANPDIETLIELSKIFDCSVDYLLGVSDVKNASEAKKYEEIYDELISSLKRVQARYRLLAVKVFASLSSSLNDCESVALFHSYFLLLVAMNDGCKLLSDIAHDCESKFDSYLTKQEGQEVAADALRRVSGVTRNMFRALYLLDESYISDILSNVPLDYEFEGYMDIIPLVKKYRAKIEKYGDKSPSQLLKELVEGEH